MRKTLPGPDRKLAAVVLAAGSSSRLGRSKQLLRIGSVPLIVRAVRLARNSVGNEVIVVLGADALRIRYCLQRHGLGSGIVMNPRWHSGMAGSLRAGLRQVPAGCAGALVLLADQALLAHSDLALLVRRWQRLPRRPAAAQFSGRSGAPAILPRRLFRAMSSVKGDRGARQLLREHPGVTLVPVPSAAFDLDTPTDAAAISVPGFR